MKLSLSDLTNLRNEQTAVGTLNSNNTSIETALENTVSRDGTSPNSMSADFDMNSNRILNLPDAASAQEPATLAQLQAIEVSGGGAPTTAAYVVISATAGLDNERILTAGDNITIVDGGAGSTITIAADDVTVGDGDVTNAKLADMAQDTIKGRASGAGTGAPVDLTATQATAILNEFTDALKGLVPASGGGTATFLRADGQFATPAGGGDVSGPGSSVANTLAFFTDTSGTVLDDSGVTVSGTTITVGNTGLVVGASTPFSDSAGALTLQNVDALDATTEATIEAAIDTLANLTSIQGQAVSLSGGLTVGSASSIGGVAYVASGTDVALADGGTGASLADPGADRGLFWDDGAGAVAFYEASTGLEFSGTSLGMTSNQRYRTITFVIDGGGSTITTGVKGDLEIPFACTIDRATLLADQSGSIVIDIWNDTYANFPPTDADTITAAAPPTISTDTDSQDATLTGWDTAIAAGDILRFNVDSVTSLTRVTLSLRVLVT
jgi:hypothetical protein